MELPSQKSQVGRRWSLWRRPSVASQIGPSAAFVDQTADTVVDLLAGTVLRTDYHRCAKALVGFVHLVLAGLALPLFS
ncbi:MAG: hypothetical protein C0508_01320 [Cyanobacteria bacterium PR.023]|nr:hypothetical protein [Cyanobacteria bacterium PR.023]